jgi:hypothetical protein
MRAVGRDEGNFVDARRATNSGMGRDLGRMPGIGLGFGMRTGLQAVAVSTKSHLTGLRPQWRVLRRPPTVLIQPNDSSIRLRLNVLMR